VRRWKNFREEVRKIDQKIFGRKKLPPKFLQNFGGFLFSALSISVVRFWLFSAVPVCAQKTNRHSKRRKESLLQLFGSYSVFT
jgi:hypothetical protein